MMIFPKNMSIRSCSCSSNLTEFLLIRQEFVFFTEGGGKGLRHRRRNLVHVRLPSIFEKYGCTMLNLLFAACFTKHPPFWHEENRKWILGATKRKISYCNIACHPSMNMYASYEHIITNYAEILAITLVVWPRSHETSDVKGHFCEGFINKLWIFQVWYFSLQVYHIIWHHAKDSPRLDLFWISYAFFSLFQSMLKTAGLNILSSGPSLAGLAVDLW